MNVVVCSAFPGSYALTLNIYPKKEGIVGRLGNVIFPPGRYLYFGSAFGSGGVKARICHHYKTKTRIHWHIDFLTTGENDFSFWYVAGKKLECEWSQYYFHKYENSIPVYGFGSTDCRSGCLAHLIRLPFGIDNSTIAGELEKVSGQAVQYVCSEEIKRLFQSSKYLE